MNDYLGIQEDEEPLSDDYYEDTCDHEDADIDILTGRLSCSCGYSKWLTSDELRREAKLQAKMYEDYAQECEKWDRAQAATEICCPLFKGNIDASIPF